MELPSRQDYPEYYEFVKNPICFNSIKVATLSFVLSSFFLKSLFLFYFGLQGKLQSVKYHCLEEFEADLLTTFKNAKEFNEVGSQIHDDAILLEVMKSPDLLPFSCHPSHHLLCCRPENIPQFEAQVPHPGSI